MPEANATHAESTLWLLRPQSRRDWMRLCVVLSASLGAILVPLAGLWLFLGGYRDIQEWAQRIPFDSQVWKTSLIAESHEPVRIRMVDDLIRKHELRRMTRTEIVELLSEPPKTDYFSNYDFVYWLGPERGFISIDSEWLAIKFGRDDRVLKFAVVRD